MRINTKLIIIIFSFIIIPMGSVGIASFYSSKKNIEKSRLAEFEAIADLKKNKIITFFKNIKADIQIVQGYYNIKTNLPIVSNFANNRTNPSYIKAKKMLDEQLGVWEEVKTEIVDLMLVNLEGKIVYTSNPRHETIDLDHLLPDPGNLVFTKGLEGIYLSDIFENKREENSLGMLVSAPVYDFNKQLIGVVVLEANVEGMYNFIQDATGLGETGETLIGKKVGNKALFLSPLRYDRDAALKRTVFFEDKNAFPMQEAVNGREGAGLSIDYRGEEVIAVWRYIPSLEWGLVAKIDTSEAFALVEAIKHRTITFGFVIMAIALMLTVLIARSISQPINSLKKLVEKIGKGEFGLRSTIKTGDEIGSLARGINSMTQSLAKREDDLKKLSRAVEQSPVSIVITDAEGNMEYVNPKYSAITGYSYEEALGQNPRILNSGQHPPEYFEELWKTISAGKEWRGEFHNKNKSGELFWEQASISPIFNKEGEITNYISVKEDITDRKLAEKKRESLESQLRQVQKMETIGTLAGGIAHDFNNILTPIMVQTELMLDDFDEGDPHRKDLDHILDGVDRAKNLVRQILAFSRHEEEEYKPLQIVSIVKEAIDMIRPMLPATIEIRKSLDGDCGTVLANATQIYQVLMNICTNAYHVMQDTGGVLELNLKTTEVDEEFAKFHINLEPGRYAQLSISDTGCGMDKETLGKIFDPFFTTKEVGKGTGLGLSVVHGIITKHNGDIIVYSEPSMGTTFHIYLPLIDSEIEEKLEGKEVEVQKVKECILLVDDEKEILFTGKKMLERNGYQVETAASSVEALKEFCNNSQKYDLVITDYTIPKMTGVRLTEELLKIRPKLPVILMSGFNESVTPENFKDCGARAYVMKPFSVKSFTRVIRQVLEEQ